MSINFYARSSEWWMVMPGGNSFAGIPSLPHSSSNKQAYSSRNLFFSSFFAFYFFGAPHNALCRLMAGDMEIYIYFVFAIDPQICTFLAGLNATFSNGEFLLGPLRQQTRYQQNKAMGFAFLFFCMDRIKV